MSIIFSSSNAYFKQDKDTVILYNAKKVGLLQVLYYTF